MLHAAITTHKNPKIADSDTFRYFDRMIWPKNAADFPVEEAPDTHACQA